MRRPSRSGLSLVFALSASLPLMAQNLESIGREKPFSFAGAVSFNQICYFSDGVTSRRDPYRYFASGNLNLSLYGWTVPLSFNVSNQNTAFSQPFNQYALHPTYKSITAHVGYTAMSFSPYTVNGHVFLGGAVDFAPEGNWKISALYGRFLKSVEAAAGSPSPALPSFERYGYALKTGYANGPNSLELIAFRARDEENSIGNMQDSPGITPQENLVLSIAAGKTIFKDFLLKAEIAASAITSDTRAEKTNGQHPLARMGRLFEETVSSSYHNAFKASFDYRHDTWVLGISYARIDPQYRTLGAYYFNNDLENITVNGSAGILKGKMNIAASAGLQRDNLDKSKVSTMRRMVGAVNINYTPSQRVNVAASYSGLQTYTNIRTRFQLINQLTPYDNLDTLNFTQVSTSASLSGTYALAGSDNRKQNIHVNLTWQDAADKQGRLEQHSGTSFYNASAGYSLTLARQDLHLAVTFSTTANDGYLIETRTLGPNASISKAFFKRKFKVTYASSYNNLYATGQGVNAAINCRLNGAISIKDKHDVNVSAVMVSRNNNGKNARKSSAEFTGTLGYSYSFGSTARRSHASNDK